MAASIESVLDRSLICINVNEILEKYTETLKTDNLGENEPSGTITEKEIKTSGSYFQKKKLKLKN